MSIKSWEKFAKQVRGRGCSLLKNLDSFPQSILVTGCQRSGTTILARIITQSEGMVNYWFGKDDELDAALILAGEVPHEPRGRYCFQTTYLNNCYNEYLEHKDKGHKIIFVIRNPYSVVYSMVYNWKRFALNELFFQCGMDVIDDSTRKRINLFGSLFVSQVSKACHAYVGKTSQAIELRKAFSDQEIMFVEYDALVNNKNILLPKVYEFLDIPYKVGYADRLSAKSLNKADRLSLSIRNKIDAICLPTYERVSKLVAGPM